MSKADYFIGLMSGTSLDAIDAALVRFEGDGFHFVDAIEHAYTPSVQASLHALCQSGKDEINRMGRADREVAFAFSLAVNALLEKTGMKAEQITAIGSHGQTVRHHPNGDCGFTVQIGDPSTIAEQTGITTVADFRRRDIAAGGQGAPLVPAFHEALLASDTPKQIVNIGGIANITRLNATNQPQPAITTGYDIGPGNTLMDQWIKHQLNKAYDDDGAWASTGAVNQALLKQMMETPYFALPPPKSTGRELFNLEWLASKTEASPPCSPVDIQATLLELTATCIATDINTHGNQGDVIICGGGAQNSALMRRLTACLSDHTVLASDDIGISSRFMEAMAFAWLAKRALDGHTGNLPSVTGAKRAVILGGIYSN